jgi:hypothetical protein
MRAAKRRSGHPAGRGSGVVAAAAESALGGVQAVACARGNGQHHQGAEQCLLGGQPADRRMGGGPLVCRARRSVVRPEVAGAAATPAWTRQASHRLSARHRLAGAQARGVRRLSLPCGSVSQQPFPHGLRRAAPAAARAVGQGVPADSAPGGTRERGGSRGGAGGTVERGWPYGCGRRGGEAASARPGPAGHRSHGGGGGPEPVRRLTGRQGGRRWRRTRTCGRGWQGI